MDVKRKATEGIVAIPAKKAKNELALRYGARNDYDENVSSQHTGCGVAKHRKQPKTFRLFSVFLVSLV